LETSKSTNHFDRSALRMRDGCPSVRLTDAKRASDDRHLGVFSSAGNLKTWVLMLCVVWQSE